VESGHEMGDGTSYEAEGQETRCKQRVWFRQKTLVAHFFTLVIIDVSFHEMRSIPILLSFTVRLGTWEMLRNL
jgi:hypothetical protein